VSSVPVLLALFVPLGVGVIQSIHYFYRTVLVLELAEMGLRLGPRRPT